MKYPLLAPYIFTVCYAFANPILHGRNSVATDREVTYPAASETMYFQGFEGLSGDTWGIDSQDGSISNITGSTDSPANQRVRTGSYSWQVNNSTSTLTMDRVNTSGYSSMVLNVYLSSTSLTSANGADASDFVKVYVNLDAGGFPSSPDVTINGYSNARWGYDGAGVAAATAGTPATFTAQSNDYAKIEISIPDGTSSLSFQIVAFNNSTDEFWNIDDIELIGTQITCSTNSVSSFTPSSGPKGTLVTISGTNFDSGTGTSAVLFNGLAAASFNVISSTEIQADVPSGIGAGKISVETDGCVNLSTQNFTLIENDCTGSGATDLLISEYVEGISNNKYLELFNGTGADVNLSNYDLVIYTNGSSTVSSSLGLSGTLADGDVYVIANSSAALSVTPDLSPSSSVMSFNGNDVIALRKSSTNIDVVGTIGSSADFAKDVTLVRNSSVLTPTTIYTSSEWTTYAQDDVSDLGSHTFSGGNSPTITTEPVDQNECSSATFSVTGTGTIDAYQWRVYDGASWADVSDGGVYSGATAANLSLSGITATMDGYQYYCELVQSGVCTNVTQTAVLSVGSGGAPGEWSGGASADWTDCKNWSSGEVPASGSDITILSSGSAPQVVTDMTVGNLTLEASSTLEIIGATTLTVSGDLVVNSGASIDGDDPNSNVTLTGNLNGLTFDGTLQPNTDMYVGSGAEIVLNSNLDLPNESNDLTVLSGGTLNFNGYNVTGSSGDFFLEAGAAIKITSADGITSTGSTGNVQTDTRNFDTGADYYFTGGNAQVSGNAFPSTVHNLYVDKTSNDITLSGDLNVDGDLVFSGTGNLLTGANTVTLSSSSLLSGESTNSYLEGTVTLQKAINNTSDTPGNIGVSLTTSDNLGITTFTRVSGSDGIVGKSGPYSSIATTWTITPTTQPSSAVTGTFSWLSSLDNSIDLGTLEVWKNPGSGWVYLMDATNTGTGDLRTVAFSTPSFSDFTVTDNANPLPVELIGFSYEYQNDELTLVWVTASEINNSGFEVQRSFNGKTFERVGFVAGYGTTKERHEYHFTNEELYSGVYYRLNQLDFDGQSSLSSVIYIPYRSDLGLTIFPNPLKSHEKLKFKFGSDIHEEAEIHVTILNTEGRILSQTSFQRKHLEDLLNQFVDGLKRGQYFVKTKVGDQIFLHRLLRD